MTTGHKKLAADFLKHYEETSVIREGKPLTYAQMQGLGLLQPYAVRLPITMIAEFDALAHYGPWASKQEMLYQLIRASMDEIAKQEPFVHEQMTRVANEALEKRPVSGAGGKVIAKKGPTKARK
jgi:hypothetical protein